MVRTAIIVLVSLLSVVSAFGAVAKNDSGTAVVAIDVAAASINLTTFTVSAGSNRCLIAMLTSDAANENADSVSWDATGTPQAMTVATHKTGASTNLSIWYLVNPTVGNKQLTGVFGGVNSTGILGAIAFSGADQSTCVQIADNVTGQSNSAAPSTGAITSSADGATVGAAASPDAYFTATSTQTEIYRTSGTGGFGNGGSYAIGGASNTHTWAAAGAINWISVGVHVIAASGGSSITGAGRLTTLGVGK